MRAGAILAVVGALAAAVPGAARAETWACAYSGFGVNEDQSVEVLYDVANGRVREHSATLNADYDILDNNDLGLVAVRHYATGDARHRTIGAYTIALDKRDRTIVRTNTFTDSDDPVFRRGNCVEREAP